MEILVLNFLALTMKNIDVCSIIVYIVYYAVIDSWNDNQLFQFIVKHLIGGPYYMSNSNFLSMCLSNFIESVFRLIMTNDMRDLGSSRVLHHTELHLNVLSFVASWLHPHLPLCVSVPLFYTLLSLTTEFTGNIKGPVSRGQSPNRVHF